MQQNQAAADGVELTIARDVEVLRLQMANWRRDGLSVGLVPTMGALHDGHIALVTSARDECDRVVVSLFVNPIQFNQADDLERYPRDEAADRKLLAVIGVDLLYAPTPEVMYPPGFASTVTVSGLDDCLCGRSRPGHLTGVSTVVSKLLLQVLPDRAYFGEKDYQQLLVVKRMVRDLDIPSAIVPVATVRETDGLAFSSRNANLDPEQRAAAPRLHQVLREVARRGGTSAADPLAWETALAWGRRELQAAGFAPLDYLELRHAETLELVPTAEAPARLFVAAWLGETRLIDNIAVD